MSNYGNQIRPDVGDSVYAYTDFRDKNGNLADPTTIVASVKPPDGIAVSYLYGVDGNVVRESLGKYYILVKFLSAGRWKVRFMGQGAIEAVSVAEFDVEDRF